MIAGTVTSSTVLLHGLLIIRQFGFGVFVRSLRAAVSRRRCTFLELLVARSGGEGEP